jgi:hypothetical protein
MPLMLGNRVQSVILEVPCGTDVHHVRITRDKSAKGYAVEMLDHPDFNAEMVMAFTAFGAKPPACWIVAEKWARDPYWAAKGLTPAPDKATHNACPACGWEDIEAVLLRRLSEEDLDHVAPGEPMPAGICPRPQCGSFVYPTFGLTDPNIKKLEEK